MQGLALARLARRQVQRQLHQANQHEDEDQREQRSHHDEMAGLAVGEVARAVLAALHAEGGGEDVRLQINFAEHGVKWLDLRYAKLSAG